MLRAPHYATFLTAPNHCLTMVCHVIVGRPDRSLLLLLTAAIISQHIALLHCSDVSMLLDASYLGDIESKSATSRTVLLGTVRSIKSDRILVEANRVLTSNSTFHLHKEGRNLTRAGKMYTIVFIRAPDSLPRQQRMAWYPKVKAQNIFFVQSATNLDKQTPRLYTQYVPEPPGDAKRVDRLFRKRGQQIRAANITELNAKMQSQQGKSKLIVTCTVKSLLKAEVSWSVQSSDSSVSLPQSALENSTTTRQKSHMISRLELSDDLLRRGPLNISCFARNVLGQHQWSTSFEELHINMQPATTSTSTTAKPTTTTTSSTSTTSRTSTRAAVSNSVLRKNSRKQTPKGKKQKTTAAAQTSTESTTSTSVTPSSTTATTPSRVTLPSYCKSSCWEQGTKSCEITGVANGNTVICKCIEFYQGSKCHLYKPKKPKRPMRRALRSAFWQSEPVELETDMHDWNDTDAEMIDFSDQMPTPANQQASDDMSAIAQSLQRSEGEGEGESESEAETQQGTSAQSSVNCRVFFRISSCGNRPVDSTAGRSSRVLPSTAKRRDEE